MPAHFLKRTSAMLTLKSASEFVRFMESIWDDTNPIEGGYDRYHNAKVVCRLAGAMRTGNSFRYGERAGCWEWPDGTRAIVGDNGRWCIESFRKKRAR